MKEDSIDAHGAVNYIQSRNHRDALELYDHELSHHVTVPHSVKLLSAPVLRDAISAEVVLAAKADGVLVDAEADGTEELVLQAASHLQRLRGIYRGNALGLSNWSPNSMMQNIPGWQTHFDLAVEEQLRASCRPLAGDRGCWGAAACSDLCSTTLRDSARQDHRDARVKDCSSTLFLTQISEGLGCGRVHMLQSAVGKRRSAAVSEKV
ncbi:hypothetical protein EYF80_023553 [Liparis tanakae]|uniref:Uncharacterized protein n=1 Tax=Liparis tanakae TaxID=230148 RepID=A0A4Z2HMN6_9TELE|nr:hypothetical protein EYF80_023553 [Liparis tanakae]